MNFAAFAVSSNTKKYFGLKLFFSMALISMRRNTITCDITFKQI